MTSNLNRGSQGSNGDDYDSYEDCQSLEEAKNSIDGHVLVAQRDVGGSFRVIRPDGQPEVAENIEELNEDKNIVKLHIINLLLVEEKMINNWMCCVPKL